MFKNLEKLGLSEEQLEDFTRKEAKNMVQNVDIDELPYFHIFIEQILLSSIEDSCSTNQHFIRGIIYKLNKELERINKDIGEAEP
jgi:hypothetical protein